MADTVFFLLRGHFFVLFGHIVTFSLHPFKRRGLPHWFDVLGRRPPQESLLHFSYAGTYGLLYVLWCLPFLRREVASDLDERITCALLDRVNGLVEIHGIVKVESWLLVEHLEDFDRLVYRLIFVLWLLKGHRCIILCCSFQ